MMIGSTICSTKQNVVWSEVADVDRRCSHARIERLAFNVHESSCRLPQGCPQASSESSEADSHIGTFASVEFADQPTKQAREAPAFDCDFDQVSVLFFRVHGHSEKIKSRTFESASIAG
jgi:hypothetical protein